MLSDRDVLTLVNARCGKFLGRELINGRDMVRMACIRGHEWIARTESLQDGHWCRLCSHKTRNLHRGITIKTLQDVARNREGKCLSKVYIDSRTKMRWQCKEGHIWEAVSDQVKRGHWCPRCGKERIAQRTRIGNKGMDGYARSKGGRCLSEHYQTGRDKLTFRCKEGHIFSMAGQRKNRNQWCPFCSGVRHSLEKMQKIAETRGGKCLSKRYTTSQDKLTWQCAKGHIWRAQAESVYLKSWCPTCRGFNKSIKDLDALADKRGFKLLSRYYKGSYHKYLWECSNGHQWRSIYSNIAKGQGCPYCAGKVVTIKDMRTIAKTNGGKCLSRKYLGGAVPLKWQCAEGHVFEAKPSYVSSGNTWCPNCNTFISESICRKYFEEIFQKKFPTRHPKWLVNSLGNRMEFDGYCPEINIAFEYQGMQHYTQMGLFSISNEKLRKRRIDDQTKRELARKHRITLIEIPYTITYEGMGQYILDHCKQNGVPVPDVKPGLDYRRFNIYSPSKLSMAREIAEHQGGQLLSKTYVSSEDKLRFRCSRGHVWHATLSHIKWGTWCPKCAGITKLSIQDMKQLAKSKGGRCLSKEYVNSQQKIVWQCKKGHTWEATGGSVRHGTWCPICGPKESGLARRFTINDCKAWAAERGGDCLSRSYRKNQVKLTWQCDKGHTWKQVPNQIRQGAWCPHCARNARLTIQEMRELATKRGGECLSRSYVNARTKLKWRCKQGHEWESVPDNVKHGHWCKRCTLKQAWEKRKSTINDMKKIARKYKGDCLSKVYVSAHTKLQWRCEKGHEWSAIPDSVKRGHWCGQCGHKKESAEKPHRNSACTEP